MKKDINRIMDMFLNGSFSRDTEEKVQKWIIEEKNEAEKEKASLEYWDHLSVLSGPETYAAWKRVKSKSGIDNIRKTLFHSPIVRQIAVILLPLLFLLGGYILYQKNTQTQWKEISVPYGDQQQLILSDGTTIRLNAGSKLCYPKRFDKQERIVYLQGEAFFDVESNLETPFVVNAGDLIVKVTGTSFNIKFYPEEEQVTTTLFNGKVDIYLPDYTSYSLLPDQQLSYNKIDSTVSVQTGTGEEANAWIHGQLLFTNMRLEEIWKGLERRFDIQIIDQRSNKEADKLYTVRFVKDDSLEDILSVLKEMTGISHYQIEGRNIYLYK